MMVFLYVNIYIECWKFINLCLVMDLKDIEKIYMLGNGFYMWVVEWEGKVVGMVGLVNNCSYKLRVVGL